MNCCNHRKLRGPRHAGAFGLGMVMLFGLGLGSVGLGQDLLITEFMADADFGLLDEDGESQDWIEIHNPNAFEMALTGWSLTDDVTDPTRWTFPGGSIGPRGFVLVFASGKDRRDPSGEWHTNFKLERDGEYLALIRPDGLTPSTEFSPAFPPQVAGASYGLGMAEERLTLVPPSAAGRARAPAAGEWGDGWESPAYDDSGWNAVQMGIGYERPEAVGGDPEPEVADVTQPGDVIYPTSYNSPGNEGVELAIDDNTATKYLNFDKLYAGFTVTPGVGATVVVGLRVTSANDAPERDPVSFTLEGSNDGVQFTEIARGALPDFPARFHPVEVRFENSQSFRSYRLLFPEVRNAASAVAVQVSEVELLGTVGRPPAQFAEFIGTDIEGWMYGSRTTVQVRLPFVYDGETPLNDLFLNVRYDDGFVAYLNGTEVVRANAPTGLAYNSVAASDRARSEATQPEAFAMADWVPLLVPGQNVLGFLALNNQADSLDFLLSAELANVRATVGAPGYFATPTPGDFNAASSQGRVAEPVPSVGRGFIPAPLDVVLSSATPGAVIRYTTDGSAPSETAGELYTGAIRIAGNVPLRAIACKEGWLPSPVATHTYLYLPETVAQSDAGALARGFPSAWGSIAADYGMDQRMVAPGGQDQYGGVYAEAIQADLLALPSISLVMDPDDCFGALGIYSNPENRGDAWERPVSFEIIDPARPGEGDLQVDAGARIQGGAFRRFDLTLKKSFRLVFRREYGPGMLDYPLFGEDAAGQFNTFILRANSNDAWPWGGGNALYVRDAFAMETARAMGIVASHTRFMHLYLNGLYWGLYNPVERPDSAFSASYHGGDRATWDALNQDGLVDGTPDAWNQMLGVLGEDMSSNEVYQRIQGRNPDGTLNADHPNLLDVDNMIDYMIMNLYIGNADWPHRNYWVGRDRAGTAGFQFYPWDSETALGMSGVTADRTGVDTAVARPYAAARANADFRMRFADRVHRHFSEGGVFYVNPDQPAWDPAHPENNPSAARFVALAAGVEAAIVAESARWGDQKDTGPFTRDGNWAPSRDNLLQNYFPQRSAIVLDQFRAAGLYPTIGAPVFSPRGGSLEAGETVTLSAPAGTIYYTTDGSDPRQPVEIEVVAERTLISGGMTKRVLIPTTGNGGSALGDSWRLGPTGFDDSLWTSGTGGVGYDTGTEYNSYIGIDIREDLYQKAGSVYVRVPFHCEAAGLDALNAMTLRVRTDDGFVAYLNGVEIASLNAPGTLAWDSFATGNNPDEAAVVYRAFDVTSHLSALRAGENLLAIHGLNVSLGSSDFLLDAELEAAQQRQVGGGEITASVYTGPLQLEDLTRIKARALQGAEWSALSEATFLVGHPRLVISELNYHPADPTPEELAAGFGNDEDFEFIELYNAGDGSADLRGVRFVDGVEFDFATASVTHLAPGESLLLVRNRAAFEFRYGPGLPVAGEYSGKLSNAGEWIEAVDASGQSLLGFAFGTTPPWPTSPDGGGFSLELPDPTADPSAAASWQPSLVQGGTPGAGRSAGQLWIDQVRIEASSLTLGFQARAGRTYEVRRRSDWNDAWMPLKTVPAAAVAGLQEVTLALDPLEPQVFFQLVELP
ncbi:MAG: CotH kinase family protein [Verrucomicrobiales bacterium]|nr:CotH kinase family protein [Verrucomicrobiales bacterium]